jgi:hypothetical protein
MKAVKTVKNDDEDFMPGDPSLRVVGREEKPARVHRPLDKKERKVTERTIRADIKFRMQELEPLVDEYRQLSEFLVKFDAIIADVRA